MLNLHLVEWSYQQQTCYMWIATDYFVTFRWEFSLTIETVAPSLFAKVSHLVTPTPQSCHVTLLKRRRRRPNPSSAGVGRMPTLQQNICVFARSVSDLFRLLNVLQMSKHLWRRSSLTLLQSETRICEEAWWTFKVVNRYITAKILEEQAAKWVSIYIQL